MNRLSRFIRESIATIGFVGLSPYRFEEFLNNVYYGVDPRITDDNGNLEPIEISVIEQVRENIKKEAETFHDEMEKVMRLINYRFEPDYYPLGLVPDFAQTADITLLSGTGDCEDIARVVCAYGAYVGYKTYILLMLGENEYGYMGHAVGIVKVNDRYYAYELDRMIESDTVEGIAHHYGTLGFDTFYLYEFHIDRPVNERIEYVREVEYDNEDYKVRYFRGKLFDLTPEEWETLFIFTLYGILITLVIVRFVVNR